MTLWGTVASIALAVVTALPARAQSGGGPPSPVGVDDFEAGLLEATAAAEGAWIGTLVEYGQFDAAIAESSDALARARARKGSVRARTEAALHAIVARAWLGKGEFDRADLHYRLAADRYAEVREEAGRAGSYDAKVGRGWVLLMKGDPLGARRHFEDAKRSLAEGQGGKGRMFAHELGLARAHLLEGNKVDAARLLSRPDGFVDPERDRLLTLLELSQRSGEHVRVPLLRLLGARGQTFLARELAEAPSERHAIGIASRLNRDVHLSLAAATQAASRDANVVGATANAVLATKGLVLDIFAARFADYARAARTNEGLRERMRQHTERRAELAALVRKPWDERAGEGRGRKLAELDESIDRLAHMMAIHVPKPRTVQEVVERAGRATHEEVAAALPPDAALVEFVRSPTLRVDAKREAERWGEDTYSAIVIRPARAPVIVSLGPASALDAAVHAFRGALSKGASGTKREGSALYRALVTPVEAALSGATRLVIAPDGSLHLFPFEALVDGAGKYWVESREISYAPSGRALLQQPSSGAAHGPPLIIGSPQFALPSPATSSTPSRSVDFREVTFPELPGTLAEGRVVSATLAGARLLTGAAATPDALLLAKSPSVLHVATHGFFLPEKAKVQGTRGQAAASSWSTTDPLVRSGLAMAGADGGRGIVSALELSSADFRGTELAVLSACETGLGDVVLGEGVFGLRRALSIAGVRTQIMSLWQVDDSATLTMMTEYYGRLRAGEGRADALRNTRLSMLANKATRHPYYWASFVLSGETSRLPPSLFVTSAATTSPPPVPRKPSGCACELSVTRSASTEYVALLVLCGALSLWRRARRNLCYRDD